MRKNQTTEEQRPPYLKRGFWKDPDNQFWVNGKVKHTKEGIEYIKKALKV